MRAYAHRFREDPEVWGVVGLLHDFDYERYPDVSASGHPNRGAAILREKGLTRLSSGQSWPTPQKLRGQSLRALWRRRLSRSMN